MRAIALDRSRHDRDFVSRLPSHRVSATLQHSPNLVAPVIALPLFPHAGHGARGGAARTSWHRTNDHDREADIPERWQACNAARLTTDRTPGWDLIYPEPEERTAGAWYIEE